MSTTSMDLAGITSVNEFLSEYYLAELFPEKANEAVKGWSADEKGGGPRAPHAAVQALYQLFSKTRGLCEGRAPREEKCQAVAGFAAALMDALGYGSAEGLFAQAEDAREGEGVPVWRAYADERTDAPALWALTALKPAGGDAFQATAFCVGAGPEGGTLEDELHLGEEAGEVDVEGLVGFLFFDVPEPPRFLLLITADELVLFDRTKWAEKRCMRFDLRELYSRRKTGGKGVSDGFAALATFLAKSSLVPAAEDESLLDQMDRGSRANAQGVSEKLKYALRECIEILGNEVVFDWTENKGEHLEELDAGELSLECIRYLYRLLFLLYMEARPELGFAPMKAEAYAEGYSLESLRDVADGVRGAPDLQGSSNYLQQTLSILCDLVYNGYPKDEAAYHELDEAPSVHDTFRVPPLKAHIFDEERTPLVRDAYLRDSEMLKIIDLLSVTKSEGGKRRQRSQRISYATLGINQLGAVYEGLLSYRGFIATEDLYEVKKAGTTIDELEAGYFVTQAELENYTEDERVRVTEGEHKGDLVRHTKGSFVYRLAGREREKSASFYTPESLTHTLVEYALKDLLEGKTSDEILQITVCEPAMGSASFLNEAIDQLAEAYLARKQEELGKSIDHDERALELQRVKMYIADRNVYGIDLNPVAVELGEVSLWLNTVSQDGFVPWFGNQLICGNSLIGARRRGYTERQLTSKTAGTRWYDCEPETIGYETGCAKSHRIYHFLVFDPGMASYTDKTVKDLEPEAMARAKQWNNAAKQPYTKEQVGQLRHLSRVVDELWAAQIEQERAVREATQDALSVYGHAEGADAHALTIREKDAVYKQAYLSEHARNAGPYARLKFAMDYWCSLWFWPLDRVDELPSRDEFLNDMAFILEGTVAAAARVSEEAAAQQAIDFSPAGAPELNSPVQRTIAELEALVGTTGEVDLDRLCERIPRLALARQIAGEQHFFHWELEFADLFRERGGFDLIVGNPPWVKLEWKQQDVLSDHDPVYAIRGISASETAARVKAGALDGLPDARADYLDEYVQMTGQKSFFNAPVNYPLMKGQQTNLYRCFLPQGWDHMAPGGAVAFVHPDGILNDSKAAPMRKEMLRRYRKHFEFSNELRLFSGVHHETTFALNIYGDPQEPPAFDHISNLYDPATIAACYGHDGSGPVPAIKDQTGGWNTRGHAARIVHVGEGELAAFATLLGDKDWRSARVPNVHAEPLMQVLDVMASQTHTLRDLENKGQLATSVCWDETNARKNGTIKDSVAFPASAAETVYSAPFIGVGNPLYQGTRRVYRNNSDYDPIDLTAIGERYLPRTKYARACSRAEYDRRMPTTPWGQPFDQCYRLANREYVGCSSERTLQAAILPPGVGWINKVFGWTTPCLSTLTLMAGYTSSLPFDYFVRAVGKVDVNYATTLCFPIPESPLNPEIRCRALLLNCLTRDYAALWEACWDDSFAEMEWSKHDPRLAPARFYDLSDEWSWDTPLRGDYERRQALVELDVLCAMALGLSLEQLEAVYRLDFAVLQDYEQNTWYDATGRAVASTKNLGPGKPKLRDFNAKGGSFTWEFDDDTLPNGPVHRSIRYEAPFTTCDRVADYRQAWDFFARKYGMEGGAA